MSVSADALRTHIDYNSWASQRLVDAAALLSPDDLNRDFETADRSVLGTLVHVFAADRLWLSRLAATPHPGFVTDADRSLPVLRNDWPALREQWKQWAQQLTDEQSAAPLAYTDMKGRHWKQPIWQLVLHVVNHGTHHRGQVTGFLRTLGQTPPVHYYRERG
ncbi:MAG TPA: DinB family protein [Bryobacteraceae bacterium]